MNRPNYYLLNKRNTKELQSLEHQHAKGQRHKITRDLEGSGGIPLTHPLWGK